MRRRILIPKRYWPPSLSGAMRGHSLPRRFPLISADEPALYESQIEQDTVVEGEPILRVRGLVTRFPLRSGLFNRVT